MTDSLPPIDNLPEHWQLPAVRVLITGANGHLGQRLIRTLGGRVPLRALVRSERAKRQVENVAGEDAVELVVGNYDDPQVLQEAVAGCSAAVHLVGIIKESRDNSFSQAHVATTQTLVAAAEGAGLQRLIYLSIVGARIDEPNPCLSTKAQAEQRLLDSSIPATVFQVPMVLGEGDYASAALKARASSKRAITLRASSMEQPIYAGDVVRAVVQALLETSGEDQCLALPGPERLSRGALIQRAGAVLGNSPAVTSLPVGLGLFAAAVMEKVNANPPVTRAMLGVLDHDDLADAAAARDYLDFELVGLDEMLGRCFVGE